MKTNVTYRIYTIYNDVPAWNGIESKDKNYIEQEIARHIETYPYVQVQLAKVTETIEFI